MIRRPPRSTLDRSSAASDVYKRQVKPTLTRAQIITAMQQTAQYYPSPNSSRGYGNINAGAAVALASTY